MYNHLVVFFDICADMAELADALDLGSSVFDVRVQVPLSAVIIKPAIMRFFSLDAWLLFLFSIFLYLIYRI